MKFHVFIAALLMLLTIGCSSDGDQSAAGKPARLIVFAAASLQDVIMEIGQSYEESHPVDITYNFAGSNVLARQLVAAPKADVYLSASEQWMDYVQNAGLLLEGSRRTFLSNSLVVIANKNSQWKLDRPADLASLEYKYLSLANPEAVPAGQYAKSWLESISVDGETLWERVKDRVAPGPDVRAALGLVEAETNILGIVYRTDAAMSDEVKILYEVPTEQGPPIRYAAAVLRNRSAGRVARDFLAFLDSPEAAAIFEKYGFIPLDPSKEQSHD
ncbi:MAG TPA: molybdate ABC transporter substrate-binding protein [bacterium]|nr:molybdate ABC transporter substrate-binding protein [bacterium]